MRVPVVVLGLVLPFLLQAPLLAKVKPSEVVLELTHPAGVSPKVFTEGWVFGARLKVKGKDYSEKVHWRGTGTFKPDTGATSRPVFNAPGTNTITLFVKVDGEEFSKSYQVVAVSPLNYAAFGDRAFCQADIHASPCPVCPHPVIGPISVGGDTVQVRGRPAARKGDPGRHAACCGPNTFTILEGDPEVLIDGKPAARFGDKTKHCGGIGKLVRETSTPGESSGAEQVLTLNLSLNISGPTVINHSVPWAPTQSVTNQPSKNGPYLLKDGVKVGVKGQAFSAEFTSDSYFGKAFPSQVLLQGTFNATRTAIETLSVTLKAERATPGVRESKQWSFSAKGIPLTAPNPKRLEFVVRAAPQERPKGFQLVKADFTSSRREEHNTVQGKTAVSEFREDQLKADQAAVTLDLTFRPQ